MQWRVGCFLDFFLYFCFTANAACTYLILSPAEHHAPVHHLWSVSSLRNTPAAVINPTIKLKSPNVSQNLPSVLDLVRFEFLRYKASAMEMDGTRGES